MTKQIELNVDDFGRTGGPIQVIGECWEGGKVILRTRDGDLDAVCVSRDTVHPQAADRQPGMGVSRVCRYTFELAR